MDSKYCSACARKQLFSCFLKDATASFNSKVFLTCILCREKSRKRRAEQPIRQSKKAKPARDLPSQLPLQFESHPQAPPLLESRPQLSLLPESHPQDPPLLESRPQAPLLPLPIPTGFLPAEQ
jgi:hypothetical protein